jgi:hypothetical protein
MLGQVKVAELKKAVELMLPETTRLHLHLLLNHQNLPQQNATLV